MFDRIEQTIISQHGLMGTQRARGTAVETDNEQSHMLSVGTAYQIHKTKTTNHIATEKKKAQDNCRKKTNYRTCASNRSS
jgi:hypothetical protein